MSDPSRYSEDLPQLAAESFALAERRCGPCRHLHSVWPYLRLSRASTGVEGGRSHLEPLLSNAFAAGRRKILIAGAADTGILALVARASAERAGAGQDVDVTVLDACDTPLDLCRRFGARWSLPLATMHVPLQKLEVAPSFDLVPVHGTLHFIAPDQQQDAAVRMARALRPDGRLVLLYNTSPPLTEALSAESRSTYATTVIDELERQGIPLPEPREAFRARLDAHARNRETREGVFPDQARVHALLRGAGFAIDSEIEIAPKLAQSYRQFIARMAKRRFLAVAKPGHGGDSSI